jgi:hypothetical protein
MMKHPITYCTPRRESIRHHIRKDLDHYAVFDTPDFKHNGRSYRIIATRKANGETWHTVKNDKGELKEIENLKILKWLGI